MSRTPKLDAVQSHCLSCNRKHTKETSEFEFSQRAYRLKVANGFVPGHLSVPFSVFLVLVVKKDSFQKASLLTCSFHQKHYNDAFPSSSALKRFASAWASDFASDLSVHFTVGSRRFTLFLFYYEGTIVLLTNTIAISQY